MNIPACRPHGGRIPAFRTLALLLAVAGSLFLQTALLAQTDRMWTVRGAAEAATIGLSADGRTLYTGARQCLRAWSSDDGRMQRTFQSKQITAPYFSPDGRFAIARSPQLQLVLYDAATFTPIDSISHDAAIGFVTGFRFSPDGARLLVMTASTATLYDVPSMRLIWRVAGIAPSAASFSRHGAYLAWTDAGALSLFRSDNGRLVRRLPGAFAALESGFAGDDAIVVGYDGRRINTWNLWDGTARQTMLDRARADGHHMLIDRDGRYAVTWSEQREGDSTMRVWEVARGARIRDYGLGELTYPLRDAIVTSDAASVVVLTAASRVSSVGLLDGRVGRTLIDGPGSGTATVGFLPDHSAVVVGAADGTMRFYAAVTGELQGIYPVEGTVVRFSDDMRTWMELLPGERARLRVRETASGALVRTIPLEMESFNAIAVTPDLATIAWVRVNSDAICIVDAATGRQRREIGGHGSDVLSLDIDRTGTLLTSYGRSHNICVWSVATGALLRRIDSEGGYPAFTPGGDLLTQARSDGIAIWGRDAADDRFLPRAAGYRPRCIVTPDDRWLLYSDLDISAIDFHEGRAYHTFADALDRWPEHELDLTADPWSETFISVSSRGDLTRWRIRGVLAAPDETAGAGAALTISPSIARDEVSIGHSLGVRAEVVIELFDANGECVRRTTVEREPGRHSERLDVGALAPGVYVVRVRSSSSVRVGRMIVVR